ncbi:hypothetical protein MTO96_019270 [Rhipicephalus appendiculatus]
MRFANFTESSRLYGEVALPRARWTSKRWRTCHDPGAIKTHLPFNRVPYSPQAKYIFVARNPYDCCVSFYHHTRAFPAYRFAEGSFDAFLDAFLRGKVDCGDYFDQLLSWYDHIDDENVLFVTYEKLKSHTSEEVIKDRRLSRRTVR